MADGRELVCLLYEVLEEASLLSLLPHPNLQLPSSVSEHWTGSRESWNPANVDYIRLVSVLHSARRV